MVIVILNIVSKNVILETDRISFSAVKHLYYEKSVREPLANRLWTALCRKNGYKGSTRQ